MNDRKKLVGLVRFDRREHARREPVLVGQVAQPTASGRGRDLQFTVDCEVAGLVEQARAQIEAQAAKTNIWYPQDARASLADVRAGKGQVLFLMNATPVADVRQVAEAGEVMPQKSTFFYPKIPTGLAIHTLDPTRAVLPSPDQTSKRG